jgi:actin-related protein
MVESPESNVNKKNRDKIYEVMFEKFQVAGMQVAMDSVLSLQEHVFLSCSKNS